MYIREEKSIFSVSIITLRKKKKRKERRIKNTISAQSKNSIGSKKTAQIYSWAISREGRVVG